MNDWIKLHLNKLCAPFLMKLDNIIALFKLIFTCFFFPQHFFIFFQLSVHVVTGDGEVSHQYQCNHKSFIDPS